MKRILLILVSFVLLSFWTQQEKTVTIKFTLDEIQLVYDALGELPAKQVEQLRARIVLESRKQLSDTTGQK